MVTITVLFEGGADPRGNPNAATVENTTHLREGFNKLLNSKLNIINLRIQAEPAYSITNAVQIRKEGAFLLIDLDGSKSEKQKRLEDNNLLDIQAFVFFMVQRMEAWIISQPEVIEEVFKDIKTTDKSVAEDELIKGKDPQELLYPDWILNTVLQRFFSYEKGGKLKKLKYLKLKHSPSLIAKLNIDSLCETFEDVQQLMDKITSQSQNTSKSNDKIL